MGPVIFCDSFLRTKPDASAARNGEGKRGLLRGILNRVVEGYRRWSWMLHCIAPHGLVQFGSVCIMNPTARLPTLSLPFPYPYPTLTLPFPYPYSTLSRPLPYPYPTPTLPLPLPFTVGLG